MTPPCENSSEGPQAPFNPGVFRAYDIRGLVDRDFDDGRVLLLGKALGTFFLGQGRDRAVLGRDCRASSPGYAEALALGMASTGLDVVRLGLVSTPMLYFAVKKLGLAAGVMVTASHNPPQFNGFKIWNGETTLHTQGIQDVRLVLEQGVFAKGQGLVSHHDIEASYIEDLLAKVRPISPLRVVVDGGNGSAGEVTARLLERAGCEVVRLFCEPDGRFPNHHPDPVVEDNVVALRAKVLETGAACGLGLDGDGDRLGVLDERGRMVFGDRLLMLYARELLARKPGATVLGDVKCSDFLFRDIESRGGRAVMGVTGHSIVKSRMIEEGAELAGEMSGHMFFKDRFYGFDDASYAALRLVEVLSLSPGTPLSALLADWPDTVSTPEIRMDCPDDIKFAVVERARRHFARRAAQEGYSCILIDGVRLDFGDGWGLIRASNTQAALVLRFEAADAARLAEIRQAMEEPLNRFIAEA